MGRTVHHLAGVGWALQLLQHNGRRLRRVSIDTPTLIVVRQGAKTIYGNGIELRIQAGEAIAFAPGPAWDMVNEPGEGGFYHSDCVAIAPELLTDFPLAPPGQAVPPAIRGALRLGPLPAEFADAFGRAWNGLGDRRQVPEAIARQRVQEVLVWLRLHGGVFTLDWRKETVARVRGILAGKPDRRWQSAEVARRMGMSEATLRRHLAAAGVSFSGLLIDVRMSVALTLLQATGMSILEIATTIGYASPSRFAVRFRQRFGQAPSELRAPRRRD